MSGWRNSDWPEDGDHNEWPLGTAWVVGAAILAVLAIAAFVLIAAGLVLR